MHEYAENDVPEDQLSEFARSLFGYLYFQLEIQNENVSSSGHFKEIIGRAVLRTETNACEFNDQILNHCGLGVPRLTICQKICTSYPSGDYFKKLYYITAFIIDVMIWYHRHPVEINLSEGPDLWICIFRNEFEGTFHFNGGWKEFTEAGKLIMMLDDEAFSLLPSESLLPNYFRAIITGLETPPLEPVTILLGDVLKTFESIDIQRITGADEDVEMAEIEETEEEQVGENQGPPAAEVEVQPGGSTGRKRRYEAARGDSESESESENPSPSKAKMERK